VSEERQFDAIIIGAGIAGLTAALHLAERGLKPLVLEARERGGGRLAGGEEVLINDRRFPLEHGVHGVWSSYSNFRAMLERHQLVSHLNESREEQWIYRTGSFIGRAPIGSTIRKSVIPAPFHYIQLFAHPQFLWMLDLRDWAALLNVWSVLVMAIGIDPFVEDQPLQGLTFGAALKNWGPAIRALFFGLTRNGLSIDPDEVSLAGFLAFLRFYTLLRRQAWTFSYFPDGSGEVIQNLLARVQQLGGEVRFGSRATRAAQNGKWQVRYEQAGQPGSESSAFVILATDSPGAESIIQTSFPDQKLFFPHGLAHAVIRLWFDASPRKSPEAGIFTGNFMMHNFFWLEQIYDSYKDWHVETGGACIELHVYGPRETLAQSDAVLLTGVLADFYRAFPELRGHLIKPLLQRNAATHTLPALGERGSHLGIETPWENFYCAGDWVRHPNPSFFLERACTTGLEAANRVLGACDREPFEVQGYPPPEPFAGWIEGLMIRGRRKRRAARQ
jgi:carotenoid phi-ring synthase / carotenoid chi-ring synthase